MDELQARDALVGAWGLVSWENGPPTARSPTRWAPIPSGYMLYTADGRFSVTISRRGRVGFAADDVLDGRGH
jgi:hypothetical protein